MFSPHTKQQPDWSVAWYSHNDSTSTVEDYLKEVGFRRKQLWVLLKILIANQTAVCKVTGCRIETRVQFLAEANIFLFATISTMTLGPAQPPRQRIVRSLSSGDIWAKAGTWPTTSTQFQDLECMEFSPSAPRMSWSYEHWGKFTLQWNLAEGTRV
jgi:hypothetical protein